MTIPLEILFEQQTLNELFDSRSIRGFLIGAGIGMATGGALGYRKYANALEKYVRRNGLNPGDPRDAEKIEGMSKILFSKYVGGRAAIGGVVGGALGSRKNIAGKDRWKW